MKVHIGLGSVVVEEPDDRVRKALRRFTRSDDGCGAYEDLYTMSMKGDVLVTMPGFAKRVSEIAGQKKVVDERIRMPEPDIRSATERLEAPWRGCVTDAIAAGGGVVAIPQMLGVERLSASIVGAFGRDGLADRGTPISLVASKDRDSVSRIASEIRKALPGRDVGMMSPGSYTDSDDVIVATYNTLGEIRLDLVGVFIGDDVAGGDVVGRAEWVSSIRNAARWGVHETPMGWHGREVDIAVEGLFGPVSAHATYEEAVEAGIGAPITVCWLPAPRPKTYLGSADMALLEAISMQENDEFVRMVSDIVRLTPPELGVIAMCESLAMERAIEEKMVGITAIHRKTPCADRRAIERDLVSGTVRKAVSAYGCAPDGTDHAVMVAATCGGAEAAGKKVPWRRKIRGVDRSYIVDFSHTWDMHNGRPGLLARNDEARKLRYADFGFGQIWLNRVSELPFI